MSMLSIILPCFNEAENIEQTLEELERALAHFPHEILIIDDHSSDNLLSIIEKNSHQNIRYFRLSRRSGSHTAIRAGLKECRGNAALFMSADGQDDPHVLGKMIAEWKKNKQVVWAIRNKRENEPYLIMRFSQLFYSILRLMIGGQKIEIDVSRADFCLLDRRVVDAINCCQERNTSLYGLILWAGFKQGSVSYDRKMRRKGDSKWTFFSRFNLAKDWIIAFSALPLKMMIWLGSFITAGGAVYAFLIIYNALHGKVIEGWPSLMVTILFLGGLVIMMLGVIGEYLWRCLDETRKRPIYFLEESREFKKVREVSEIQKWP